jgi:hypothetical protein
MLFADMGIDDSRFGWAAQNVAVAEVPGNGIPNEDGFVAADQDAVIPDVLAGERFAASPDFDGPDVCPGAVVLDVVLVKRVVHGFCFLFSSSESFPSTHALSHLLRGAQQVFRKSCDLFRWK